MALEPHHPSTLKNYQTLRDTNHHHLLFRGPPVPFLCRRTRLRSLSDSSSVRRGSGRSLDLKVTGRQVGCVSRMSRNNGKSPKVDRKPNLSLSATRGSTSRRVAGEEEGSPNNSSSPSSCVSSDAANSPEATSMVLAGCPRCLMYVMLAEEDPKCPKCKSTVLLDFTTTTTTTTTTKGNGKNRKS